MHIILRLVLTILCLVQAAPASSAYNLESDIVYDVVTEADGDGIMRTVALKLDFYRPSPINGRTPLVIYVHGGCFVQGSKSSVPAFVKNLANEGIAVASIDYRLAYDPRRPTVVQQKWPYPAALKDVQQAVRFLRKNDTLFQIDTSRIAVHGESTGGYFAAALGVVPATDRQGNSDSYAARIDIVSDWYGRTDFTLPKSEPTGKPCHEYWLGMALTAETKPLFEKAGILPYVNKYSASRFQIMHGNKDPQVDIVHSISLMEKLRKAGIKVKMYMNQGWGHNFAGSLQAEALTRSFLIDALRGNTTNANVLSRVQINTGRTDTKDPEALPGLWKTDQYMDANAPGDIILYDACRDRLIGNTTAELSKLYWDVRYGKRFGYKIPVTNGTYRIRLHFAECRYTAIGQRRFNVNLFGIPILRNYDILKSTGGLFATANIQELFIIVKDGKIDLSFANVNSANANINALEIERIL